MFMFLVVELTHPVRVLDSTKCAAFTGKGDILINSDMTMVTHEFED